MMTGGRWARCSREDEVLSRLYQQVTELQAARFGGGYDIAAGRDRFHAWLRGQADESGAAVPASTLRPLQADPTATGLASHDADRAVTTLYRVHYRSLVRLAALLTGDIAIAEEIVQDSFVAAHAAWPRLLNSDEAVAYLRRMVVSRCRSLPRRRPPAARSAARLPRRQLGDEHSATVWPERSVMVAALRALPPRQREALVLRYYGDLSESQAAAVMGISKGAVRTHTARAMSTLSAVLEARDDDLVSLDTRHKTPADSGAPDWPDPDGHRYA